MVRHLIHRSGANMKRILLILSCAFVLYAQADYGWAASKPSKFDTKLEEKLKKGNSSEKVRVIIQTDDLLLLPKFTGAFGKVIKRYQRFPGFAVEIALDKLPALENYPSIKVISIDEPMKAADAIDGTEA